MNPLLTEINNHYQIEVENEITEENKNLESNDSVTNENHQIDMENKTTEENRNI